MKNKIDMLAIWTLIFLLAAGTALAGIRHVTFVAGGENVVITWDSDDLSDSVVRYSTSADLSNALSTSDPNKVQQHSVTLTSLQKDTNYYFAVQSTTEAGVTTTDNNNGKYYEFVLASPNTITFEQTPELVNSNSLVVAGTTKANSNIDVRVNAILQGTVSADATGRFSFTATLSPEDNYVELTSRCPYGSIVTDGFHVRSDASAPVVTVGGIADVIEDTVELGITASKESIIKVYLNGEEKHTTPDYITAFPYKYTLTLESQNQLKIEAVDRAGNTGLFEQSIEKIPEPEITISFPDVEQYGGVNGVITVENSDNDIRGKTAPGAKIFMWIFQDEQKARNALDTLPSEKPVEFTADENGDFVIEVTLEDKTQESRRTDRSVQGIDIEGVTGGYSTTAPVNNYVVLRTTDNYNRSDSVKLNYEVSPCGTGGPWAVVLEPDAHSLKPYRLKDGTERLNFRIKLDWIGWGEYIAVNDVRVMLDRRDITPDMYENDDYKCVVQGDIFPTNLEPIMQPQSNAEGTYWYMIYRLEPYQGLNDTILTSWGKMAKSAIGNSCVFPLRVVIDYQTRTTTGQTPRLSQEHCVRVRKYIDTVVDPNKVIPDFIMDNSIELLNTTLDFINDFMPKIEWAVEKTRYACWASAITYGVVNGVTRTMCTSGMASADSCASWVGRTKFWYNKLRLACDRIWCNPVPVNPGKGNTKQCEVNVDRDYPLNGECTKDPLFACLPNHEEAVRYCGVGYVNVNNYRQGRTDCYREVRYTGDTGDICCKRKDAVSGEGYTITSIEYMDKEDWQQNIYSKIETNDLKTSDWEVFVDEPWDYGAFAGYVTETMDKMDPKPVANPLSGLLGGRPGPVLLGPIGWVFGKSVAARTKEYTMGTKISSPARSTPLTWNELKEQGVINQNELDRIKLLRGASYTDDVDSEQYYMRYDSYMANKDSCESKGNNWNSAKNICEDAKGSYVDIKSQTPQYEDVTVQYVSGLHGTQCFNQRNIIGSECFFDPKGGVTNFPALVQCGCINDVYGRLDQFRNIAQSMLNCLTQVKTTGAAEAGACKMLFAQHVCDLLTGALMLTALKQKDPATWDVGESISSSGVNSAFGLGFTEALGQIREDYGTHLEPYVDFNVKSLTHSMCMGSLFNEWDPGFTAAFRGERGGPPHESDVVILPSEREQLGSNPVSGTATYEYRVGVSFTAGSAVRELRVYLVCDEEGDCKGQPQQMLFRTEGTADDELPSGMMFNIEKNAFVTFGGYMHVGDDEQVYWRFNKVIVEWVSEEGAQYNGRRVKRIDDRSTQLLGDCKIAPSTALASQPGVTSGLMPAGNDIILCKVLAADKFAYFIQAPPITDYLINIDPNLGSAEIKVPFTINAQYSGFGAYNKYLLVVQEETVDDRGSQAIAPQQIEAGLTSSEIYRGGYITDVASLFSLATSGVEAATTTPGYDVCTFSVVDASNIRTTGTFELSFKPEEQKFKTRVKPIAGTDPAAKIAKGSTFGIEVSTKTPEGYPKVEVALKAGTKVLKTVALKDMGMVSVGNWKHLYSGAVQVPADLADTEKELVINIIAYTQTDAVALREENEAKIIVDNDTAGSVKIVVPASFTTSVSELEVVGSDKIRFRTQQGAKILISDLDEAKRCVFEIKKGELTARRTKRYKIGIYEDLGQGGMPQPGSAVFYQGKKQEYIVPVVLQKSYAPSADVGSGDSVSAQIDATTAEPAGTQAAGASVITTPNVQVSLEHFGKFASGTRNSGATVDTIVLHHTGSSNVLSAVATLLVDGNSAHYIIDRDGTIYYLVDESRRAFHATDYNSRSIGIEIVNTGNVNMEYTDAQYAAIVNLGKDIISRWPVITWDNDHVLAHYQMPDSRTSGKWDPSPKFDWSRIGLASHPMLAYLGRSPPNGFGYSNT